MIIFYCKMCDRADVNRTQGEKIRCKRFSVYVDPNRIGCNEKITEEQQRSFKESKE